jgi:hypothetical protein
MGHRPDLGDEIHASIKHIIKEYKAEEKEYIIKSMFILMVPHSLDY